MPYGNPYSKQPWRSGSSDLISQGPNSRQASDIPHLYHRPYDFENKIKVSKSANASSNRLSPKNKRYLRIAEYCCGKKGPTTFRPWASRIRWTLPAFQGICSNGCQWSQVQSVRYCSSFDPRTEIILQQWTKKGCHGNPGVWRWVILTPPAARYESLRPLFRVHLLYRWG